MTDMQALCDAIRSLHTVVEKLRGPGGCPWDQRQTMPDLLSYTTEEVAELIEAVEEGDPDAIRNELADLLFHCVFYAQIAQSQGHFDLTDVVQVAVEKLERRHPHVFSENSDVKPDEKSLNRQWQAIKRQESASEKAVNHDKWIRWQPQLSALWGAWKLQQTAAGWGFDWPDATPVLDKLQEEIHELKQAICGKDQREIFHELGDVLFSVVNLARHLQLNPERALSSANRRFYERVRLMCALIEQDGHAPDALSVEALEVYWQEAKRRLSSTMPGSENQ